MSEASFPKRSTRVRRNQDRSSGVFIGVPKRPKWAQPPTPEERAAQLQVEERETTRDIRRAFFSAAFGCISSTVAGLVLMGWALHTTDRDLGNIAFFCGLIVGYAGITVTLARLYLRGERAGWW